LNRTNRGKRPPGLEDRTAHAFGQRTGAASAEAERLWASADLGSNTFRLLIAREAAPGRLVLKELQQAVVRLGEGLEGRGALLPQAVERAERLLSRFRARLDTLGVRRRFGALTAAGRRAADGPVFCVRASELLGGDVRILTGGDEARLSAAGALSLIDIGSKDVLFLDIGGGSTEIVSIRGGESEAALSIPTGVVKLFESLPPVDSPIPPNPATLERLDALAAAAFQGLPASLHTDRWSAAVACGRVAVVATAGTPLTVAAEVLGTSIADTRALNGALIGRDDLERVWSRFVALSAPERLLLPSVESGREDVILAGLALLRAFLSHFRVPAFTVSDGGLLEGVLLEAVSAERGTAGWIGAGDPGDSG
jgi:exopolyphosphatase/guanosine-5'-triphosphate,3'-diphosphate pyrophosphatase